MILKGDKLKNTLKKGGIGALSKSFPSVRCHFDNGQEYYGKERTKPLFSWQVKGDFRIELLPFLVSIVSFLTALCSFVAILRHKQKNRK